MTKYLFSNPYFTNPCFTNPVQSMFYKSMILQIHAFTNPCLTNPCFANPVQSIFYKSSLCFTICHKFPPSLTLLSFKTRIKWPQCWSQLQIFQAYFFNSCNIQGNVQAIQFTGLLWWRKLLSFSSWFVDFVVQFASAISFHSTRTLESSLTVAWFSWTNQNSFFTHSNQWDCFISIDNRLRQMAFFRVCQSGRSAGQRSAFEPCWKILK